MKVYLRLITHQLSYRPSFCTARPTSTCRFSGVFDQNTGSHSITMRWAAFGFIYRFWRAKGWRTRNTIHISVYYMNLLIKIARYLYLSLAQRCIQQILKIHHYFYKCIVPIGQLIIKSLKHIYVCIQFIYPHMDMCHDKADDQWSNMYYTDIW